MSLSWLLGFGSPLAESLGVVVHAGTDALTLSSNDQSFKRIGLKRVSSLKLLPSRVMSRAYGAVSHLPLPVAARPYVYGLWSWMFKVKLDEADCASLAEYKHLTEFFTRRLKPGARKVDERPHVLASPVDGAVVSLSCDLSSRGVLRQVKGIDYHVCDFLGLESPPPVRGPVGAAAAAGGSSGGASATPASPAPASPAPSSDGASAGAGAASMPDTPAAAVDPAIGEKGTALFSAVLYLAPGDYHAFHSPTEFEARVRTHIAGQLLPVNPAVVQVLPSLFCANERVALIGSWSPARPPPQRTAGCVLAGLEARAAAAAARGGAGSGSSAASSSGYESSEDGEYTPAVPYVPSPFVSTPRDASSSEAAGAGGAGGAFPASPTSVSACAAGGSASGISRDGGVPDVLRPRDRMFFSYTAVGATNVGSIRLDCEPSLVTNTYKHDWACSFSPGEAAAAAVGSTQPMHVKDLPKAVSGLPMAASKAVADLPKTVSAMATAATGGGARRTNSAVDLNTLLGSPSRGGAAAAAAAAAGGGSASTAAAAPADVSTTTRASASIADAGAASPLVVPARQRHTRAYDTPVTFTRGDNVGVFELGSTIVLVFEAPVDFKWTVREGDKLRVGQALGHLPALQCTCPGCAGAPPDAFLPSNGPTAATTGYSTPPADLSSPYGSPMRRTPAPAATSAGAGAAASASGGVASGAAGLVSSVSSFTLGLGLGLGLDLGSSSSSSSSSPVPASPSSSTASVSRRPRRSAGGVVSAAAQGAGAVGLATATTTVDGSPTLRTVSASQGEGEEQATAEEEQEGGDGAALAGTGGLQAEKAWQAEAANGWLLG